jgi:hypothetical protein
MTRASDRNESSFALATGIKTAVFVCVIGFVALAASRVFTPAAIVDVPAHAAVAAPAAEAAATTAAPSVARPAAARDESSDGRSDGDNHPASF